MRVAVDPLEHAHGELIEPLRQMTLHAQPEIEVFIKRSWMYEVARYTITLLAAYFGAPVLRNHSSSYEW